MAESLPSRDKKSVLDKKSIIPAGSPYKIALLCGGSSNEREVSLASATNVEKALSTAGHDVVKIDTAAPDFFVTLQRVQPDVAFIALHGKGGEDGTLQAMLELLGIPYTGSGVLGSALAIDKHRSKIVYRSLGIKTAPWIYLRASEKDAPSAAPERIIDEMGLSLVVKPSDYGSSMGIMIVREEEALPEALVSAFSSGSDVLVEKFVKGTEITVAVLGTTDLVTLPAIEIIPKNDFYDYESKYAEEGSKHIIPARISDKALAEANRVALLAHESLDCYSVSRTDMIIDENDDVWVIETNTIPGMTSTSLLPDAAGRAGISNQELYEMLIAWALERAQGSRG